MPEKPIILRSLGELKSGGLSHKEQQSNHKKGKSGKKFDINKAIEKEEGLESEEVKPTEKIKKKARYQYMGGYKLESNNTENKEETFLTADQIKRREDPDIKKSLMHGVFEIESNDYDTIEEQNMPNDKLKISRIPEKKPKVWNLKTIGESIPFEEVNEKKEVKVENTKTPSPEPKTENPPLHKPESVRYSVRKEVSPEDAILEEKIALICRLQEQLLKKQNPADSEDLKKQKERNLKDLKQNPYFLLELKTKEKISELINIREGINDKQQHTLINKEINKLDYNLKTIREAFAKNIPIGLWNKFNAGQVEISEGKYFNITKENLAKLNAALGRSDSNYTVEDVVQRGHDHFAVLKTDKDVIEVRMELLKDVLDGKIKKQRTKKEISPEAEKERKFNLIKEGMLVTMKSGDEVTAYKIDGVEGDIIHYYNIKDKKPRYMTIALMKSILLRSPNLTFEVSKYDENRNAKKKPEIKIEPVKAELNTEQKPEISPELEKVIHNAEMLGFMNVDVIMRDLKLSREQAEKLFAEYEAYQKTLPQPAVAEDQAPDAVGEGTPESVAENKEAEMTAEQIIAEYWAQMKELEKMEAEITLEKEKPDVKIDMDELRDASQSTADMMELLGVKTVEDSMNALQAQESENKNREIEVPTNIEEYENLLKTDKVFFNQEYMRHLSKIKGSDENIKFMNSSDEEVIKSLLEEFNKSNPDQSKPIENKEVVKTYYAKYTFPANGVFGKGAIKEQQNGENIWEIHDHGDNTAILKISAEKSAQDYFVSDWKNYGEGFDIENTPERGRSKIELVSEGTAEKQSDGSWKITKQPKIRFVEND